MKKITALLLALMLSFTLLFIASCGDEEEPNSSSSQQSVTTDSQKEETPSTQSSSDGNSNEASDGNSNGSSDGSSSQEGTQNDKIPAEGLWATAIYRNDETLGEGEKSFTLTVKAGEQSINLTVNTNKSTVGDALTELGLLEGEDGQYGLFVKKVNGILADYDVDQTYWALYINGEYAMTGVDSTDIVNGTTYTLSRE